MTGRDINERLNAHIEEVVTKVIFPNGKKIGKEWCVGGIDGRPGESLKVMMSGPKVGAWTDFAGAPDERGDLIELWIQAKSQGDQSKGMAEIREYLGLPSYKSDSKFQSTDSRSYDLPKKNWVAVKKNVGSYLEDRGLSRRTIKQCVFSHNNSRCGQCYVFIYRYADKPAMAKYVALKRRPNGKKIEWTSSGSRPVLWGMELGVPEGWDKYSVVITEGEIDAMSFRDAGIFAVSVPFGSKNHQWVEHCYDWLTQFNTIYLAFDGDEAGVAGVKALSSRLGVDRIRVVTFPDGEDANSIFQKGKTQLTELIADAKPFQHERMVSADEMLERTMKYFQGGRPEEQGIPFMGWRGANSIKFRLRPSEMTIHTGYPSGGKSTGLYQLFAYLALVHKEPCAIASTEVDPEQIVYTMATQAAGEYLDFKNENDVVAIRRVMGELLKYIYIFDFKGIAKTKEMMEFFSYCCRVKGAKHCAVDSITNSDIDLENPEEVKDFLNATVENMHYTGAHHHLVAHLRKGDMMDIRNIPRFDAVKGTNAFGALTFNALTWWRNFKKEDAMASAKRRGDDEEYADIESRWPDSKVLVSKQKIGGQTGEFDLWYDHDSYSFRRSFSEDREPMIQLTEDDEIEQPF